MEKKPAWKCSSCGGKFMQPDCITCTLFGKNHVMTECFVRVQNGYVGGARIKNGRRKKEDYEDTGNGEGSK